MTLCLQALIGGLFTVMFALIAGVGEQGRQQGGCTGRRSCAPTVWPAEAQRPKRCAAAVALLAASGSLAFSIHETKFVLSTGELVCYSMAQPLNCEINKCWALLFWKARSIHPDFASRSTPSRPAGFSNLEGVDLRSERNIFILGFGLYCGLSGESSAPPGPRGPHARMPRARPTGCQPDTITAVLSRAPGPCCWRSWKLDTRAALGPWGRQTKHMRTHGLHPPARAVAVQYECAFGGK